MSPEGKTNFENRIPPKMGGQESISYEDTEPEKLANSMRSKANNVLGGLTSEGLPF